MKNKQVNKLKYHFKWGHLWWGTCLSVSFSFSFTSMRKYHSVISIFLCTRSQCCQICCIFWPLFGCKALARFWNISMQKSQKGGKNEPICLIPKCWSSILENKWNHKIQYLNKINSLVTMPWCVMSLTCNSQKNTYSQHRRSIGWNLKWVYVKKLQTEMNFLQQNNYQDSWNPLNYRKWKYQADTKSTPC